MTPVRGGDLGLALLDLGVQYWPSEMNLSPSIHEESPLMSLRITAVSPFLCANPHVIVEQISNVNSGLIVLPGWRNNGPSLLDLQQVLRPNVSLFAEVGLSIRQRKAYLITSLAVKELPVQTFIQRPSLSELSNLSARLPERIIELGGFQVAFFLCGEIHAFDVNGMPRVEINHPFDVLINPAHFIMGRWHILGKKLEALSRAKVVVHVANNDRNNHRLSTDVRIYAGGEQVGERNTNIDMAWKEFEVVRSRIL